MNNKVCRGSVGIWLIIIACFVFIAFVNVVNFNMRRLDFNYTGLSWLRWGIESHPLNFGLVAVLFISGVFLLCKRKKK
jgi:hypothetical protein